MTRKKRNDHYIGENINPGVIETIKKRHRKAHNVHDGTFNSNDLFSNAQINSENRYTTYSLPNHSTNNHLSVSEHKYTTCNPFHF